MDEIVFFDGVVVGYEETPEGYEPEESEYILLLDGSFKNEESYEGYFYLVASRDYYGVLDLGIGSNISGKGILLKRGEEPIIRYLGEEKQ